MTEVKNRTKTLNTTKFSSVIRKSNTKQNSVVTADAMLAKATESISAMNVAEGRSRKAVAEMVAVFVEMAEAYLAPDATFMLEMDKKYKAHGLEPVNLDDEKQASKNANVFLPMMSIVSGQWVDVIHPIKQKPAYLSSGKIKQKWQRNRSFEKYASVIRFFIYNEISHTRVVDILMADEKETIEAKDLKDGVRPRINDIIVADRLQQKGARRAPQLWTDDTKTSAAAVKPLAHIVVSDTVKQQLNTVDGYTVVIARVENDGLSILFDSGLEELALKRLITKRLDVLNETKDVA